jgi:hypothetical protein
VTWCLCIICSLLFIAWSVKSLNTTGKLTFAWGTQFFMYYCLVKVAPNVAYNADIQQTKDMQYKTSLQYIRSFSSLIWRRTVEQRRELSHYRLRHVRL